MKISVTGQLWTFLNATLILLMKESTRYDKQQNLAWNHAQILTPNGMESMEEAFQNVNVQDFKVYLTENDYQHTTIASKKSTSKREYSVIIPKSDTLGSGFGKCTLDFQRRKGSPVNIWWQHLSWGKLMDRQGQLSCLISTQQHSGAINFLRILILLAPTRHSNQLKQTQLHVMN
jgi:hypothetical protein